MARSMGKPCRNCGANLDWGEKCDCQKPEVKEEAAKEMLESLKVMQENGYQFPCPRCGYSRMSSKPTRNALSRHASIYICDECGIQEALLAAGGKPPLLLSEWSIITGYLSDRHESAV